ncbi:MAG: type IV toxin-antitoxin system AbiEi family antitoxin domain-containing protein [Actinomycetota bacterium]|nr:type IV toxin-antitoxin system AbiEi family antitoxin domain-containing protein [Actinomycetota bacterium]
MLDEIFRAQHGVISCAQAIEAGLSPSAIQRRIRIGGWERVHSGVYRHAAMAPTWETGVIAAVLTTGGIASHRSAARLHRLDGFGPWAPEVTIPVSSRRRPDGVIVHRSTQFDRVDPVVIGGIHCTGVDRTVLDLGAVMSMPLLEKAAESALRLRRTTWPRLHQVLLDHSQKGRDGCGVLRALLEARYGDPVVPLSEWSRDVAQRFEAANLPPCVIEYRIVNEAGLLVLQVDLAFPTHRVAVELDSIAHHLDRVSFERDRRLRNELRRMGWVVLEVTWKEWSARPGEVISQVRGALARASVVDSAR